MKRFIPVIASMTLLAAFPSALCARTSLELGAPAPPLQISEWVKGTSTSLEAGRGSKVHVIEFWATWCPPCRMTIPHLTELQKKYADKGVTIIGVSAEDPATVKPFVSRQGEAMGYTVAVDRDRATYEAYMTAFGVSGIPHAFVVDKAGRIVWHGHPMGNLDKTIENVLAGTHDVDKAKREMAAMENLPRYFELAAKGDPGARELGESIVADAGSNVMLLNQMAWVIATAPQIRNRDLDLAERAARAGVEASEARDASVLDTYARVLHMAGKKEQAIEMQKKAVSLATNEKERAGYEQTLRQYEGKEGGN